MKCSTRAGASQRGPDRNFVDHQRRIFYTVPLYHAILLDQRFHLGRPTDFGWLLVSFVFAWAGWRLGRRAPPPSAHPE